MGSNFVYFPTSEKIESIPSGYLIVLGDILSYGNRKTNTDSQESRYSFKTGQYGVEVVTELTGIP